MPREKTSTRVHEYRKDAIFKRLKEAETNVLASLDNWSEKLEEWKQEAPAKFAEAVSNYQGKEGYFDSDHFNSHKFEPPRKPEVCRDWRIQAMHRLVIRIDAMPGDIIKLALNDPLWDYINIDDCL